MLDPLLDTSAVRRLIDLALEEDLGRGDVTTQATIDRSAMATAHLVAREPMVLAGLGVCTAVFEHVDRSIVATELARDGERLTAGARVASYRGPAASLLAAERTALNFVQRLSGTATLARTFVAAAAGSSLRIADTRKTTPGFRLLEKYAVRMGGASNHRFRFGLGRAHQGQPCRRRGRRRRGGAKRAREGSAWAEDRGRSGFAGSTRRCAGRGRGHYFARQLQLGRHRKGRGARPRRDSTTDARSVGRRDLVTHPELARTGVDIVSAGALTHSAPAMDPLEIAVEDTGKRP